MARSLAASPLSFKTDAQLREEINGFMFLLDSNQDSYISRTEFDYLNTLTGGAMDANMMNTMFSMMDTNSD